MNFFVFKKYSFYVILFTCLFSFSSISHAKKLLPPDGDGIYFGALQGFGGDESQVYLEEENPDFRVSSGDNSKIASFDRIVGKKAMWSYFADYWDKTGNGQIQGLKYPKEKVDFITSKGKIPFIRFLPTKMPDRDKFRPHDYTVNSGEPDILRLSEILSGNYDDGIRAWAVAAKQHYDANNTPLLIDFAVEMNGYWFEWGGAVLCPTSGGSEPCTSPEAYKEAYIHVIKIFRDVGVEHVTWFFHASLPDRYWYNNDAFNGEKVMEEDGWAIPSSYYPGDDYIDWIGFSLYGREDPVLDANTTLAPFYGSSIGSDDGTSYMNHESMKGGYYPNGTKRNFQYILDIGDSKKPIALLEFGVAENGFNDQAKSDWFNDMFDTVLSSNRIKAINFWNESWDVENINNAMSLQDSSEKSRETFADLLSNRRFVNTPIYSSSSTPSPQISSPVANSTLTGDTQTFVVDAHGATLEKLWVYAGSSIGARDYFSGGNNSAHSVLVKHLPTDGSQVYVRFWYKVAGKWTKGVDLTYTAATAVLPEITSPAPNSTLIGDAQTFVIDAHGATLEELWVYAGSSIGARDYFSGGNNSAHSVLVKHLPTDGSQVYVRFWYKVAGNWRKIDTSYKSNTNNNSGLPYFISPIEGTTLSGSTQTFMWSDNGNLAVNNYWLEIGTSQGANDIFQQNMGLVTSKQVSGLPTDGSIIYVRLYFNNTDWDYVDFTYTTSK